MKNALKNIRYKLPMLQLMLLTGICAFAQDSASTQSSSSVTHSSVATATDNTAMWYMNPWVWAGGGVLLILILVAVFRGNSNNNRSEVTRTTRTTTEIKND